MTKNQWCALILLFAPFILVPFAFLIGLLIEAKLKEKNT